MAVKDSRRYAGLDRRRAAASLGLRLCLELLGRRERLLLDLLRLRVDGAELAEVALDLLRERCLRRQLLLLGRSFIRRAVISKVPAASLPRAPPLSSAPP